MSEFIAIRFCPKTEIKDYVASGLQNFYGDLPHQFFNFGMALIVFGIINIMPEKKMLSLIGGQS